MTSLSLLSENTLLAAEECLLEGVMKRLKAASEVWTVGHYSCNAGLLNSVKSIYMEELSEFDY